MWVYVLLECLRIMMLGVQQFGMTEYANKLFYMYVGTNSPPAKVSCSSLSILNKYLSSANAAWQRPMHIRLEAGHLYDLRHDDFQQLTHYVRHAWRRTRQRQLSRRHGDVEEAQVGLEEGFWALHPRLLYWRRAVLRTLQLGAAHTKSR